MQYLVDTDWAIDYVNGIRRTVLALGGFLSEGLGISIVSVAELYDGVFGATNLEDAERELNTFFGYVEIVPLDDAICRIFARERRRLRAAGNIIGDLDLMIGATALHHGLTLLTNNRRHFQRIEGLDIISL